MITSVANEYRLSDEDSLFVEEFERKLQIVRDRVNSVVHLYHTACYLVGRPGTSKTYTVKKELERLDVPWAYRNARMTPMGMFDFIAEHPEHILVLDDIGTLFKNEQALQILLAALDGDPGEPRLVSYKSKDEDLRVWFSGGIIAISNVALRHDPLARALGSRVTSLEHEPTDDEIAAFMRFLALKGYKGLGADDCLEVAEFVIDETRECDQRLDLRHLTKAWDDYRQYKDGRAQTPWEELVRTSLHKLLLEQPVSKQEEIEIQRELVRELIAKYPDDTKRQLAESGLRKSTFYNRHREVRQSA
jgi:hypothetical protein